MARLTCYGGAGSATGANFMLEVSGNKFLIDCGMEQGLRADEHNHRPFPFEPKSIDALFVTHSHIDHVGLIPKLVRDGFAGDIYSTSETREISALLLADAAKISSHDNNPLYTFEDVERAFKRWREVKYHEPLAIYGLRAEFLNAGHILGSAMVRFTLDGKSMLFTGDVGNSPSMLLPDVERVAGLDYLLMESVYGDRNHEDKAEREEKFERIVSDSIERGGTLLIPAFSLERTQEILLLLDEMFEEKKLPSASVYLDSPLALKVTGIFERSLGDDHFNFKELVKIARVADSQEIDNEPGAKIIIAGSGMSTAGRILGHEARFLPDPNSTILFMGYQAVGTLGRQIIEGVKKVSIDDMQVKVNARVERIDGFSGHADSDALVKFVEPSASTLKKVFVAMGEPASQIFLAQRLRDELNVDAMVTEEGKSYMIDM